jgi:hypothetical protein
MQQTIFGKGIILLNALSIFPLITVLSSMKMVLSQTFNIGIKYNTIVAYAGLISASRFLFISIVRDKSLPFFSSKVENYKKWVFLGSLIMAISLNCIYIVLTSNIIKDPLTLVLIITFFSTLTVAGEGIYDAAMSVFYSNYPNRASLSASIFFGHKIAAFLGYFLFPFAVNYIGIHIPFLFFIALSFFLCTTVFKLPAIVVPNAPNSSSISIFAMLKNIFLEIKETPEMGKILLFITTCQFSILTINGIKFNFIATITQDPLLAYLLRGLSIIVGMLGGYFTNLIKSRISQNPVNFPVDITNPELKNVGDVIQNKEFKNLSLLDKIIHKEMNIFVLCGILQLLSVLINYMAMTNQGTGINIFSVIFENLSKGFLMYSLTSFFLLRSKGRAYLLTFYWGYFQIVRSFAGGISGYLFAATGIHLLFLILVIFALPPIILPLSIKQEERHI